MRRSAALGWGMLLRHAKNGGVGGGAGLSDRLLAARELASTPMLQRSAAAEAALQREEVIKPKFPEHYIPPQQDSPPPVNFNDPKSAFANKTTSEIVRSLLVFRLCRISWVVKNADRLLALSKSVFGTSLVNWVVANSFYKQFVGGADAAGIRPTLDRLASAGIHAVLDYAAEDDVADDDGPKSREPPTSTVIARTYPYEDEKACDVRLENFLRSVEAAASPDQQGFAAIKVTALGMPRLLERVSNALLAVRGLFGQLDEEGRGFIEPEGFRRVYSRLFSDADEARMSEVFDYLDTDRDGMVDYVSFAQGVSIYDGAEIAARCKEDGPFKRAALDKEELRLLDNMTRRVNTLAEAASKQGVRLMIDAEHTYFQPAIDSVTMELQRRYNRTEPRIYGTYQCYLKDVQANLDVDLERARRGGYKFGCKLVRGAYMVLERRRALEKGTPSPIWDTKSETDTAYDAAVASLLPRVRDEGAEFMVASHNQASVEAAVEGMAALGLPPSAPVYYGQLLGMADHLTFTLGAAGYGAYKYVPFGGVDEVMPYLIRRAQENSDVLGGVAKETGMLREELVGRVLRRVHTRLCSARCSLKVCVKSCVEMLRSRLGREVHKAAEQARSAWQLSSTMRAAGFATKEVLGDSLSEGHYDIDSPGAAERPLARDINVRRARSQQRAALVDRGAGILHDSMSDGLYNYRRRSSVADPSYFLGNSLSEGHYEMPTSLRGSSSTLRSRQVFRSAGPSSLPMMQRVVMANHRPSSMSDPQPLGNSYGHGDYDKK